MKKNLNLLDELIIQILLRLPVKSLVRFKCVCKSWLSLISDPNFSKSHFELGAACTHRLMFIASSVPEARSIDLNASLNDDSAFSEVKLNFLLTQSCFGNIILGSCRGYLFLNSYPNPCIWSPSTGVYKQIPWSPIASNINTTFFTYLYGFGHDPSTDDYLVVLASYDPTSADWLTHLEIFSLRTNTWKEIKGTHFPYMNASDDPRVGSLLNDAIHWLAYRHDINDCVIVAFDLTERSITDISLPQPDDSDLDSNYCDLWVFNGFLSLWVMGINEVDIWVMKEYKAESSWTKTLVLSMSDIPNQYFSPVCTTKNGDIVGTDGESGLVKYNDKEQLIEHHSYEDRQPRFEVAMYTDSLLSLPSVSQQAEEDPDNNKQED